MPKKTAELIKIRRNKFVVKIWKNFSGNVVISKESAVKSQVFGAKKGLWMLLKKAVKLNENKNKIISSSRDIPPDRAIEVGIICLNLFVISKYISSIASKTKEA